MRSFVLALLALGLILGIVSPAARAAQPAPTPLKNRGLYISPLRSYISLTPGTQVTRAFTVANLTDQPITVSLNVEKFSVADYTYNYSFAQPDNDYVSLIQNQLKLEPFKSQQVAFRINIPTTAAAGGQYYSLFAKADLSKAGFAGAVRAASLLYVTVDGTLRRTAQVMSTSAPRFVYTPTIPYSMTIKNTGNIHYFGYFSARVEGLFYRNEPTGDSRLLMPDATRTSDSSVASPLVPGIYKLTYSVTPDQGNAIGAEQYFIFMPPWSWAVLAIFGFTLLEIIRRHKKKSASRADTKST